MSPEDAKYDQVGQIIQKPPGRPPQFDPREGRNWLVIPPDSEGVGPLFRITKNFWISGPGGWNKYTYRKPFSSMPA